MVIMLIRRFIRPDREDEFLAAYMTQSPNSDPAFQGETLTKVSDDEGVPADLRGLSLGYPNGIAYLNIASWKSWAAFRDHFAKAGTGFDPEIETAPAQVAVLDVVEPSRAEAS
jgi:hypothetical protein